MKLNYDKNSTDPTYFGQIGIRNGSKTTTKNVLRIGKHSELLKITDDPLAYARQIIEEENKKKQTGGTEIMNLKIDFSEKLTYTNVIVSKSTNKNIGYFFFQQIYFAMGIKAFFKKIQNESKVEFDCDQINRFLAIARILQPESKLGTCNHFDSFYEEPDIQYQHILRFMDILYIHYEEYIECLFKGSEKIVKRDTSVCYYDCTNYYCEIEQEDEEYIVDPLTGEAMQGLRFYGHSKENRPNPIVQMGLFMDGKGIPLSMCINPGNTSEQLTPPPVEKQLVSMFKNKQLIYCADSGINSYDIRLYNSFSNRAFVVTQSIKMLSDVLKEAVFNDCDYKILSTDEKVSLKTVQTFNKDDPGLWKKYYNEVIYKIIPADKAVELGLLEEKTFKNGHTQMVKSKGQLEQKIVVTYSRKVAEYQKHIRDRQIDRARTLINNKLVEDIKGSPNNVKRFIKRTSIGTNGEPANDHYTLDAELIARESKYDGFYALATNLSADTENELARRVMEINSGRYKIEDCFRIMKSSFDARPIFHRKPNRIISHFMICYTALLLYRLLEAKLDETGVHYTTEQILETLRNMNVTNMQDVFYASTYTASNVCTSLNEAFGLGLDKKNYKTVDLNKLKRPQYLVKKKTASNTDGTPETR